MTSMFEGQGPQNKAEIPIKRRAPFGFQADIVSTQRSALMVKKL